MAFDCKGLKAASCFLVLGGPKRAQCFLRMSECNLNECRHSVVLVSMVRGVI